MNCPYRKGKVKLTGTYIKTVVLYLYANKETLSIACYRWRGSSYSSYKNEELPNVWHILSISFFWNVVINVLALCITLKIFDRPEGVFTQIPIHYALICSLDLISAYVLRLASNEFKKKKEV